MITLYCSPSQSQGEFEHFLLSLENHLGNIRNKDPAFEILLGDFNARSKSWWVHDITSKEGIYINWIYQITVWFFSTNIRTKTHPPKFITLHEPHFYRPTQSCNKQQRSETITSWELSTSNHIYMPNLTCYQYITNLTKDFQAQSKTLKTSLIGVNYFPMAHCSIFLQTLSEIRSLQLMTEIHHG